MYARGLIVMRQLTEPETAEAIHQLGIERTLAPAFGIVTSATSVRYAFHTHRSHQLIVPHTGVVTLESDEHLLIVGVGQAAWIPAGRRHATALDGATKGSVFFAPHEFPSPVDEVRAFTAPDVIGALVEHAPKLAESSAARHPFFAALCALCAEALQADAPPCLPRPRSEIAERAARALLSRLDAPDFASAARAAGTSPRTLRRIFRAETGMSLRAYVHRARMLWAMQRLIKPAPATVVEVALATGFDSPSAFASAFRKLFGRSPSEVRRQREEP